MKTIVHNKKKISIGAATERAIRLIATHKVVKKSDLAEGRGKNIRYNVAVASIPGTEAAYTSFVRQFPENFPQFVRDFVAAHPRAEAVIYDKRGGASKIAAKLSSAA